jgi:hypothetical protein
MGESLVGVLSLYAPTANAFAGDCGRLIQMVAPHLAATIHAASAASGEAKASGGMPASLRLVAAR